LVVEDGFKAMLETEKPEKLATGTGLISQVAGPPHLRWPRLVSTAPHFAAIFVP
jgi:hypothetical protein